MNLASQTRQPTEIAPEPASTATPAARASHRPSGGFTGGTAGPSCGMSGGISARDPNGPQTKINTGGGGIG